MSLRLMLRQKNWGDIFLFILFWFGMAWHCLWHLSLVVGRQASKKSYFFPDGTPPAGPSRLPLIFI
jgi:hypothetical protein